MHCGVSVSELHGAPVFYGIWFYTTGYSVATQGLLSAKVLNSLEEIVMVAEDSCHVAICLT